MQQHGENDAGSITEGTSPPVPAEAAKHVALSKSCHRSSKSSDTRSTIAGRELCSCKNGKSHLYFGFLLVNTVWVCQAYLFLEGSARTELNVLSSDLKIRTLTMKCNRVDMHLIRFSKAEEIRGWGVFLRWMVCAES